MIDRGFFISLQAIRRQLAAMPHELYLVRLIHHRTGTACPGERLWTAGLLTNGGTVRFLRGRNREGWDVYLHPYAERRNAGYILVDLDHADAQTLHTMRARGHEPCVVLQTSPGHLQAWVRVSAAPLEPAVATAIGRELARLYRADPASTDWRHLGRLAGFTNQKPQRRLGGYAPWVKLLYAQPGWATQGAALLQAAECRLPDGLAPLTQPTPRSPSPATALGPPDPALSRAVATAIYQAWLHRLRIPPRFPQPDWSIADKWIAKELLRRRTPLAQVHAIVRLGSPGFPRRHPNPDDYLRRTFARARWELQATPFPTRPALPRPGDRQHGVAPLDFP